MDVSSVRRVRPRAGRSYGRCRVARQQQHSRRAVAAAAAAAAAVALASSTGSFILLLAVDLPACDAWSDYPVIAERTAPRNVPRCYSVCPPAIFPNGPDPFYSSPYALYEAEHPSVGQRIMNPLQGGLPGRLQQVAGDPMHPIAGFWPGITPNVPADIQGFGTESAAFLVPPTHAMSLPGRQPKNQWGGGRPGAPYGTRAISTTAFVDMQQVKQRNTKGFPEQLGVGHSEPSIELAVGSYGGGGDHPQVRPPDTDDQLVHRFASWHNQHHHVVVPPSVRGGGNAEMANPQKAMYDTLHPKKMHPGCRTVCPTVGAPFSGDEPRGGPFGPDISEPATPYLRGRDPTESSHRSWQSVQGPFESSKDNQIHGLNSHVSAVLNDVFDYNDMAN